MTEDGTPDTRYPIDEEGVIQWPHIVWVRSPFGSVTPQIWRKLDFGNRNQHKESVIAYHPLIEGEENNNLNDLANKYTPLKCSIIFEYIEEVYIDKRRR